MSFLWTLLAQNDFEGFNPDDQAAAEAAAAAAAGFAVVINLISLVVAIIVVVGMWKVFEKAGKPGWAAIIPIYNIIVLLEITGKPLWWVVLFLCPCINIIVAVMVYIELAKRFNQSVGFAIGMVLLPMVFVPILGFGSAQYAGEAGQLR